MATFTIEPIEGREAIQKNFVALPTKADNYSNRHISLNERFSIIERGYHLVPQDMPDTRMDVQLINVKKNFKTREELKQILSEETAKYQKKMEKNKKNAEALSPRSQADDDKDAC